MLKVQSYFILLCLGISFGVNAQPRLSQEQMNQLRVETYEKCLSLNTNKDIDKANSFIISCMEKNGFLTRNNYLQQQRELSEIENRLGSNPQSMTFNNLSPDDLANQRIQTAAKCMQKYSSEADIIRCTQSSE